MANHANRARPAPFDDRMREAGIPCNATTRVLFLRAHHLGLTFAANAYIATGGGNHYKFAIFRGTEPRTFYSPDPIGIAVHQDALKAWLDGYQAHGHPEHSAAIPAARAALKAKGFTVATVVSLDNPDVRVLVDHVKLSVRVPLSANPSIPMQLEALHLALQQIERSEHSEQARQPEGVPLQSDEIDAARHAAS
jgi:hypothetical protein